MKLKKIVVILLAVILVFNSLLPVSSAFAAAAPFTITGADTQAEIGSQARVDLEISDNTGFSALNLYYSYDQNYFTLKRVENKDSALVMTHDKTTLWDTSGDYIKNGTLATLVFDVAEDTPFGKYEIGIHLISAANSKLERVEIVTVNATVTVTPVTAKSVSILNPDVTLDIGATEQLIATVAPENAADKSVSWHSKNEKVAKVDKDGLVTGVAYGTTEIVVTTNDGGHTASCKVSVNCEHQYSSKVVDPTYTEHGYTVYTCDICGDTYNGNFVDPLEKTPISQAQLSLEYSSAYYKGKPLEPQVYISYNGEQLDSAKELKVTYSNNDAVGTATVTVEGINRFSGTATLQFDISYEVIPEKIVNVSAISDYGKILLSWGRSSEVMTTSYNIYRLEEGQEEYVLIKTVSGRDNVSFEDVTVTKGKAYTYYVTGVGEYGAESEPSNIAGATALVDTVAPTILKLSPADNTILSAETVFSAVAEDNVGIQRGQYAYSLDGETWKIIGNSTKKDLSIRFKAEIATDITKIQIRLIVFDAEGNQSQPMIAEYVIDNMGPEKVTGLSATALSSKLTLSWNDVSADDAQYFILQQKNENGWETVATNITTLGYTVTDLVPGTTYCYRVACVDIRDNVGTYSDEFSVTTAADTSAPVITEQGPASARFNDQITFRATARDDSNVKYIIIQSSKDLSDWTEIDRKEFTSHASKQEYSSVIKLEDYAEGSLYIRAVAEDFAGNCSDTSAAAPYSEYIVDRTAPAAPENVTANGKNGYISIFWTMGKESDIDTYSVYRASSENGEYQLLASSLSAVSYHDSNVEAKKEYFYKIAVRDTAGNVSLYSSAVSAAMSDDTQKPEIIGIATTPGQKISSLVNQIGISASDNNNLSYLLVEYCTSKDLEYKVLVKKENIGASYINYQVALPTEELADGDVIHIRVIAMDMAGLSSGYEMSKYVFDSTPPTATDFAVTLNENKATLSWKSEGEADLSGFKIYRSEDQKNYTLLGSRAVNKDGEYTFTDTITKKESTVFYYKLEAIDVLENAWSCEASAEYTYVYVNTPPKAKITIPSYIMADVEEIFDASLSSDDVAISEYLWDFGDGTTSNSQKAIKKYSQPGKYTVTLTVTDNGGLSSTEAVEIVVDERETLGVLKVAVLDENNNPVPYVPVHFDLGSENQRVVNTDGDGIATMKLSGGTHLIGMYATGYLPVKKEVVVLQNATRSVTLTTVKQELVTGKFEITRMTFDEIVAAGIDVYDPANRNVYSATVRVYYGSTPPLNIQYIRNESTVLDYKIYDFNGQPVEGYETETGEFRSFGGIKYIGGTGGGGGVSGTDIIAIIDIPAEASYLKEFFDVRLHIVNNAHADFTLDRNTVTLNVPDGMTLMTSVGGGYLTSNVAEIDTIRGQETKTLAWVLRGDKTGEYDLSADFTGTLSLFNAPVNTRFETNEPIKVYGLEGVTFRILTASEIHNETLYFNIELENDRDIDIYAPAAGLTDKIKNVTESVLNNNPDGDFYSESYLLNVYIADENGAKQYIPFSFDANNNAIVNVDVLAPGQKIVYEYVAYNAIDYDGVGYFKEAVVTEFEGLAKNIEVGSFEKERYSFKDYSEKLDALLGGDANETVQGYQHILDGDEYYYVTATNGKHIEQTEKLYKTANIILNFDFSAFTQEEERNLIKTILLSILSESSIVSQSEDLLMSKYYEAIGDMLDTVKDGMLKTFGDDESTVKDVSDAVADIIKDKRELTIIYRTEGSEAFKAELNKRLAGYALGISVDVADYLTAADETASFSEVFGDVKEVVGGFFNALENTEREKYYYAVLKKHCDAQVSKTILYALHDIFKEQLNGELLEAIKNNLLPSMSTITNLPDVGLGANMLAYQTVDNMIIQLENDMDTYYEDLNLYVNLLEEASEIVVKKALQSIFAKAIGSTTFGVISAGFNIADAILGIGDYVKQQDTFDIYEAMSNAMLLAHLESIKTRGSDADFYSMLYLRALCEMRLSGEAQYKKFMSDYIDGVYLLPIDESVVLYYINLLKGTDYASFDKWGDDLQYSVARPRDLIFNIESTEMNIPRAPVVSLDYETLSTEQSFTDEYEYCFADGVWKACDGGQIPFTVGSVPSVIRVRKAAGEDNLAGKITTVKIFAQKELSKLITVKFDGVNYILENLSKEYSYQILFTDDPQAELDWSKAKTFAGSQTVLKGIAQTEYAVIRSCQNAAKAETVSKPLTVTVSSKRPLDLIIDGNGSVHQSSATGCYFVGQEIDLVATANDGEQFLGWYVNGSFVSDNNYYIAEMTEDLQITARFGGKKITGIEITNLPKKITYFEGEALDLNGLELTVSYSDAAPTVYSLRSSSNGETSQSIAEQYTAYFVSNTAGGSTIVINYGGHVVSFEVEILHDTVEIEKEEPTCGKDGLMAHYCTLCNSVIEQEAIAPTGNHNFEWVTDLEPTCGAEGKKHEECTVCEAVRSENTPIEPTGNHSFEWVTDLEPTCGAEGTQHEECTVCQAKRNENTPVDPTGNHNFEWVTDEEPTCGAEGTKHEECTVCHAKQNQGTAIDPTENHAFEWKVDIEPTCGAAGTQHEECTVCQAKRNENTPVDPTGNHSFEWVTDLEPTCGVAGTKHEKCTVCEAIQSENTPIEPTGNHSFEWVTDLEPTCGAEGKKHEECTVCDAIQSENTSIEPTGNHKFEWVTDLESTCGTEGTKHEECTVCQSKQNQGTPIEPTGNHSFEWKVDLENNCGVEGKKHEECTVCHAKQNENTPIAPTGEHDFAWVTDLEATCGAEGTKHEECTVCDAIQSENTPIEPTGNHSFEWITDLENNCGVDGKKHEECTVCHAKQNEDTVISATGNHIYDNILDVECNICAHIREKHSGTVLVQIDGIWCYVKDGEICNDNTLVQYNGKWLHVNGGVWVKDTTLVKYGSDWIYVKDGVLNTENTLVQYNGKWLHVNGGKWVKDTTLVKYNGSWIYVKEGVMSTENTLVKYGGKWLHANGGKWVTDTTLVKYGSDWMYVKDGVLNTENTLVKYGGSWFHVNGGVWVKDTTLVKYNGSWIYVNGGVMNTANTLVKYGGKWLHVNGGKWVTDTTLVKYGSDWIYVKDGVLNTENTIVKYNGSWFHVNGGKWVKDTTLVKYSGKWYYVKGGVVDFNYSGKVKYNGKTCTVKKGVMV